MKVTFTAEACESAKMKLVTNLITQHKLKHGKYSENLITKVQNL